MSIFSYGPLHSDTINKIKIMHVMHRWLKLIYWLFYRWIKNIKKKNKFCVTLQQNQNKQIHHIDEEVEKFLECPSKSLSHYYLQRKSPKLACLHVYTFQVVVLDLQCLSSHCHLNLSLSLQLSFASMRGDSSGAHKDRQKLPISLHYSGILSASLSKLMARRSQLLLVIF